MCDVNWTCASKRSWTVPGIDAIVINDDSCLVLFKSTAKLTVSTAKARNCVKYDIIPTDVYSSTTGLLLSFRITCSKSLRRCANLETPPRPFFYRNLIKRISPEVRSDLNLRISNIACLSFFAFYFTTHLSSTLQ